jgi:hypothetical protein
MEPSALSRTTVIVLLTRKALPTFKVCGKIGGNARKWRDCHEKHEEAQKGPFLTLAGGFQKARRRVSRIQLLT